MSNYRGELELVCELVRGSASIAWQLFMGNDLQVFTKEDGSKVTNIDWAVNEHLTAASTNFNIRVRSEEGGNAQYGENWVVDFDEIDGTSELIEGYSRNPRISHAAPAGAFWDNEPVAGAAAFALLGVPPIMYLASKNGGAYREQSGYRTPLWVDDTPTRGIVLVTSKKDTPAAREKIGALWDMGYTPISEHAAVFKACVVADNSLWDVRYGPGRDLPIVGYMGRPYLHDIAATTRIILEAGGVVTNPENKAGKQVWVAANNPVVYNDLWRLATAR